MRSIAILLPLLAAILLVAPRARCEDPAHASAFESMFDGRSFRGWLHSDSHWRVEGGALVGEIPAGEALRRNLFLFFEEELWDFELRAEFRIGGDASANSGVQLRARMLPDGGAAGYQADLAANRGRDRAVGVDAALEAQGDMRNEERQELERGQELVVAAQREMELAPVEEHSVVAVLESFRGDGRTFHVLEETLELESVSLPHAPIRVDVEARSGASSAGARFAPR